MEGHTVELGQFLPECSLDVEPTAITDPVSLTTSRQMLGTKGMAEDEMVGWRHQLDEHEFG